MLGTPPVDADSAPFGAGGAGSGGREPVRLWQDAGIFTLVGRADRGAHRRVLVEMYELGRPDLVVTLAAAKARGVDVRVITDPTVTPAGTRRSASTRWGCAERAYPVDDGRHQIDHVKLLVADGEAVVGGMNWGAPQRPQPRLRAGDRAAADVGRLVPVFEQDWALAGGRPAPLAPLRCGRPDRPGGRFAPC